MISAASFYNGALSRSGEPLHETVVVMHVARRYSPPAGDPPSVGCKHHNGQPTASEQIARDHEYNGGFLKIYKVQGTCICRRRSAMPGLEPPAPAASADSCRTSRHSKGTLQNFARPVEAYACAHVLMHAGASSYCVGAACCSGAPATYRVRSLPHMLHTYHLRPVMHADSLACPVFSSSGLGSSRRVAMDLGAAPIPSLLVV